MSLTHISLFAGIGGFDLAAEWAGFKTVLMVEIDPYCQKILRKHWPNTPIIGDIRDVTKETVENPRSGGLSKQDICSQQQGGAKIICTSQSGLSDNRAGIFKGQTHTINPITLITGGFPCQPVSCAGKRRGKEDDRWLWPEMLRVISEVRPTWVVAENVVGLLRMGFNDCVSDLESEGYETISFLIPACGVDSPHRRDRVFIVAHSRQLECIGKSPDGQGGNGQKSPRLEVSPCSVGRIGPEYWAVEPDVGRVAHGVPARVDRLKGLGNAVVPQQIYPILRAIAEIEGISR